MKTISKYLHMGNYYCSKKINMKLVIFDVCWTLIEENSTNFFLTHLYKKKFYNFFWYLYRKCFFILWPIFGIIYRIFKYDMSRLFLALSFWWAKRQDIEKLINSFEDIYLSKRKNIHYLKKELDNKNNKVILLSASIWEPIEILTKHYKIQSFTSQLSIKNNRYIWSMDRDLLWKKESIFKSDKIDLSDFYAVDIYTDNLEDVSIINYLKTKEKLDKVSIVINNKENQSYWEKYFISNWIKNYEFIY